MFFGIEGVWIACVVEDLQVLDVHIDPVAVDLLCISHFGRLHNNREDRVRVVQWVYEDGP